LVPFVAKAGFLLHDKQRPFGLMGRAKKYSGYMPNRQAAGVEPDVFSRI
jgi:hypothetical protein